MIIVVFCLLSPLPSSLIVCYLWRCLDASILITLLVAVLFLEFASHDYFNFGLRLCRDKQTLRSKRTSLCAHTTIERMRKHMRNQAIIIIHHAS